MVECDGARVTAHPPRPLIEDPKLLAQARKRIVDRRECFGTAFTIARLVANGQVILFSFTLSLFLDGQNLLVLMGCGAVAVQILVNRIFFLNRIDDGEFFDTLMAGRFFYRPARPPSVYLWAMMMIVAAVTAAIAIMWPTASTNDHLLLGLCRPVPVYPLRLVSSAQALS